MTLRRVSRVFVLGALVLGGSGCKGSDAGANKAAAADACVRTCNRAAKDKATEILSKGQIPGSDVESELAACKAKCVAE